MDNLKDVQTCTRLPRPNSPVWKSVGGDVGHSHSCWRLQVLIETSLHIPQFPGYFHILSLFTIFNLMAHFVVLYQRAQFFERLETH